MTQEQNLSDILIPQVERRRKLNPDLLRAIQEAVTEAFEQNAHKCLMGFQSEDKTHLQQFKSLMEDYPPAKLRESFRVMSMIVKARNTAGNVLMALVFGGLFIWILSKLCPGVWEK